MRSDRDPIEAKRITPDRKIIASRVYFLHLSGTIRGEAGSEGVTIVPARDVFHRLRLHDCHQLCWGSWANTIKLCQGYRFQLFYWDYVIGLIAGSLLWGVTLGSMGASGRPFFADLSHADATHPAPSRAA